MADMGQPVGDQLAGAEILHPGTHFGDFGDIGIAGIIGKALGMGRRVGQRPEISQLRARLITV